MMANEKMLDDYGVEPPAPHAERVSLALLFGALVASPLAWSAQLLLNYGLASHACFPRDAPRATFMAGWEWTPHAIIAINLACLVIAIVATLVSVSIWRRTREEATGGHESALDVGQGRTRFFAIWGVWAGVWFALQIVFATIAAFWAPPCGS
jgi:hypothetical protein